jgi:hypothetical protein
MTGLLDKLLIVAGIQQRQSHVKLARSMKFGLELGSGWVDGTR